MTRERRHRQLGGAVLHAQFLELREHRCHGFFRHHAAPFPTQRQPQLRIETRGERLRLDPRPMVQHPFGRRP
jgi:hypothetical protein